MTENKQAPLLSFEFASTTGKIEPLTFRNPLKLIITHTVDEVLPSLQLVQEAVRDGYYAAGFLTYESAAAFDRAYKVKEENKMPLLWFGIFSEPEREVLSSKGNYTLTNWESDTDMDTYGKSIENIKQEIEHGNTYQTNYTIRLQSKVNGDDIALFEKMKHAQQSNYCAYINTGEHRILSASPELFFHLNRNTITTKPMKGTCKRGKSSGEDRANAKWLYYSEKDRSENVMIVDLLRNDLGVIAEPGTVNVPKLFEIEQYPTVHQMTSTITAELSDQVQLVDIFKALFPCGSITGAPKISTMELIADLETTPREVYCGAIGYITPHKEAVFNVPIRTVFIDQQSGIATYGVGGGITWDSSTKGEYEEILAKSSFLERDGQEFQLLESILLRDGEYFLQWEHLQRLENSAHYFDFPYNQEEINTTLHDFAVRNKDGLFKVRFLLGKNGEMTIEGQSIIQTNTPVKVILGDSPVDKNNPFLYHKTTNRAIYSPFQNKLSDEIFDTLLWNSEGELTEFTNGNVVVEIDGKLWTPPVTSGLLAGTFRQTLIQNGYIQEEIVKVSDLENCTKIWFINSVRKWMEVELV